MFKKITIIIAMVFVISFLGFAITLPIGIKTVFGDVEHLLETSDITPEKVEIPNNIDTIELNLDNYYYYSNYVLIKQSPDDTAYLELFDKDTYASKDDRVAVNYVNENTARISVEPVYGNFKWNKEMVNRTIVKELQNYPDAILYIPTRMNIQTNYPQFFDHIYYQNKEEMMQKEQNKQEEEKILEQAERLMEQRREEEEYILERAEEIREQRMIEQEERFLQQEQDEIDYDLEQQQYYDNY